MPRAPASQSQPEHGLTEEDIDKIVSDAVFYFLVADQKKSVIKKSELYKHCGLSGKVRTVQEDVLSKARNQLARIFGINVIEPEERKGSFYLVNALTENAEDEGSHHISWSDQENAQLGLTFVLLGVIFMSGGKTSEENLFKFLRHLGLYEEAGKNKRQRPDTDTSSDSAVEDQVIELYDGDVKKFVNDVLVSRQHYLKRDRVETGDPELEQYEYTWGERARLEVKESDVFRMVCELHECEPRMFKEQYDKVVAAEGEEVLADFD